MIEETAKATEHGETPNGRTQDSFDNVLDEASSNRWEYECDGDDLIQRLMLNILDWIGRQDRWLQVGMRFLIRPRLAKYLGGSKDDCDFPRGNQRIKVVADCRIE